MTHRMRWFGFATLVSLMAMLLAACGGTTGRILAEGQVAYTLNPNYSASKTIDNTLPYTEDKDVKVGDQLPISAEQTPVFFVPAGFVVYRANPNWTPEGKAGDAAGGEPYILLGTAGSRFLGSIQNNTQLVLGGMQYGILEGELTIADTEFGLTAKGATMSPGVYHTIPNSQVRHVPAAIIGAGEIGLIRRDNGTIMKLNTGYNPVDNNLVKRVPVGTQRYRTLSDKLFADNAVLQSACSSFKCETTVDHMSIAGTNIQGAVDVDILFHFDTENNKAIDTLWGLGDLGTAVLNLIGSPMRSSRALTYTLEQLPTAETQTQLAAQYLGKLRASTANSGIVIDQVLIRSIKLGDENYQAALSQQEAQIQQAKSQQAVIAAQQAQQAQQFQLDDEKRQHDREEALKDADTQAEVNKRVLGSIPPGMDPCLYLAVQIMQRGSGELPAACTPQRAIPNQPAQ